MADRANSVLRCPKGPRRGEARWSWPTGGRRRGDPRCEAGWKCRWQRRDKGGAHRRPRRQGRGVLPHKLRLPRDAGPAGERHPAQAGCRAERDQVSECNDGRVSRRRTSGAAPASNRRRRPPNWGPAERGHRHDCPNIEAGAARQDRGLRARAIFRVEGRPAGAERRGVEKASSPAPKPRARASRHTDLSEKLQVSQPGLEPRRLGPAKGRCLRLCEWRWRVSTSGVAPGPEGVVSPPRRAAITAGHRVAMPPPRRVSSCLPLTEWWSPRVAVSPSDGEVASRLTSTSGLARRANLCQPRRCGAADTPACACVVTLGLWGPTPRVSLLRWKPARTAPPVGGRCMASQRCDAVEPTEGRGINSLCGCRICPRATARGGPSGARCQPAGW